VSDTIIAAAISIDHLLRLEVAQQHFKLRSDVEIRPESADPNSPLIVKDPIIQRFYRFTPVQGEVLRQLNGEQDSDSIASLVSKATNSEVLPKQIEDFIEKLRDLLLLDHPFCWGRLNSLSGKKRRFFDNLLSIKIRAFNPNRLLTRMHKQLSFCFTGSFVLLVTIAIGTAVTISILNWRSLFVSLGTILSLYSIPLILISVFTVLTIHEFGHALALKHFGGKVEEMGLMLLYFMPAFYCNVSDAWMLRKRERLWVTFSGGFIQLFIWACATIAWRLLAPETLASRVCLIVIAFSGIQTLFNFNPLIRLDGYYMLSDYLEIPNLRKKAFAHIKNKLSAILTGAVVVKSESNSKSSTRERRILATYGISAFIFSFGLIWVMLGYFGSWLVTRYQTWGLVIISTLFLLSVPVASKENVMATGRLLGGVAIRFKRAPHIILILALVVASGFLPWELKITGDFQILPNNEATVKPQIDGTLRQIHVDEGDPVRKGDVIADIQNLELNNDYAVTKGELAETEASLDLLKAGSRPEEIESARRRVEAKRAELQGALSVEEQRKVIKDTVEKKKAELLHAQKEYERSKNLLAQGLIPRNQADRAETQYQVSEKELAETRGLLGVLEERKKRDSEIKTKELALAQSNLKILQAGSRPEQIRQEEAQVEKLQAKLNILSQQLEYLQIRSPIDGIVATPYLKNRIGEFIEKGSDLCRVVNVGIVKLDLPIPEKEIADVAIGQPIILKVRGYPKRTFEARVKVISPTAAESELEHRIVVRGELDNPEGILKAGMSGVGKILCGKRRIGELITRRGVRWLRTEFWEYLP